MKNATFDQAVHLLKLVEESGCPCSQLQDLFDSGLFSDLLKANVYNVDRKEFQRVIGIKVVYRVMVDYDCSLAQMIEAGNYEEVDISITHENFPIQGFGRLEKEIILFRFNRAMSSRQIITEMDKQGCRPAKIEELLALGKAQPEIQRKSPIIAMGSILKNSEVPGLSEDDYRDVSLFLLVGDWPIHFRFAGLYK